MRDPKINKQDWHKITSARVDKESLVPENWLPRKLLYLVNLLSLNKYVTNLAICPE